MADSEWGPRKDAAGMGETQQTMMNLVSDKVFVFQPVVTEKSQGGFQVGADIDHIWTLESFLWGWAMS